ncbi:MAG: hypothetical protein CO105_15645 [Comamonadaceae bacterium CG_4_9_14_3_um_filter_60_33]|nr:MAG: hypothetical protein COZ09_14510 [Comamonadaceae bacterium CG_4_10_14_3_um_filter_60_42]PJB40703.1 MAG: hypothetical protein CO105_15645 [Comamonadaceae bacterium CG_4_9_14_3_um_filter_60_33]
MFMTKILLTGIVFVNTKMLLEPHESKPWNPWFAKYTGELAAWLAARGHAVRVIGYKKGTLPFRRQPPCLQPSTFPPSVGAAPSPRMPPELVFVCCGNGAGRADLVARCQGLSFGGRNTWQK